MKEKVRSEKSKDQKGKPVKVTWVPGTGIKNPGKIVNVEPIKEKGK